MSTLSVLVIADDPLIRGSISHQISNLSDFSVAGSISGNSFILQDVELYRPDILIWDLGWDPIKAVETWKGLHEVEDPILFLVPEGFAIDVLRNHRHRGFLYRNASSKMIEVVFKAITLGILALDHQLVQSTNSEIPDEEIYLEEGLTPREQEVLQLLSKGKPNKAIAMDLGISDHTVKFHVNAIMGKLGAQSRTDAVVRAARLGILNL